MRPEEIAALGDLASEAAAGAARQIHEVHLGIAGRVWRRVGPAALPVKLAHDRIAGGAYSAATELTRAIVRVSAHAASAARSPDAPSIDRTPAGRVARCRGRLRGAGRHVPYGHRMEIELGYTPVYLRYNTGRHVSENGRQLAQLLEQLVAEWPVPVDEITLIGHSMGGLVARSACHYGAGGACVGKVRHVFTLGTPHRGAPLEQAANAASVALARLPETRPLARALNIRSSGIKDMRYGYLVDECWNDEDCDAFLRDTSREIPFLPTARHYFICATLSREADATVGRIIGDLLVLQPSAWAHAGRGKRMRFPIEHYHHLGGANHFGLLNHPAIYAQMRRCLASQRALPAPAV